MDIRTLKNTLKSLLRSLFNVSQRLLKTNILPNHFYSNTPDFRELNQRDDWLQASSMVGVNGTDIDSQVDFVRSCVEHVPDDSALRDNNIINAAVSVHGDAGFGVIEADMLYAFVCRHRPAKVIQIGCGVSTAVIIRAANDCGYKPTVVCIEPYASDFLRAGAECGDIELREIPAQVADIADLTDLKSGDLFFVDSTHTVKAGSEVNRIILEVLPRLRDGVFVHFHDIFFPYDYQRDIASTLFFWSESTLLHAFLVNNNRYKICAAQSMLHYERKEDLAQLFPNYRPQDDNFGLPKNNNNDGNHFPSSLYLVVD